MLSNEDLGLLYQICIEALEKYEEVPLRALKREYNSRCPSGHELSYLSGKDLARAMCLANGEVFYLHSGTVWGIRRRVGGDYRAKLSMPLPY